MIRAFIETSLVDWDGKMTSVLFFDRCNFRCPFCQNWRLIISPDKYPEYKFEEILTRLSRKKNWVDGVVLTGGEPLLFYRDVIDIAEKLKTLNLSVKLDTNGSLPERLGKLLKLQLIDYVAMDIKAPIDSSYWVAAGKKMTSRIVKNLTEKIEECIDILMNSNIDYEFRTTCVPGLIDESAIEKIGREIKGAKKWVLQHFTSVNAYKKEYRNRVYEDERLKTFVKIAQQYVPAARLR